MNLAKGQISKEKALIGAAVFFLLIMVYLLINQWGNLTKAQQKMYEEEDYLHMANLRVQQLLEIRNRAPEFERYLAILDYLMPAEAYEDIVISELEHLAGSTGLELVRLRFGERRAIGNNFVEMGMDVAFKGNFLQFINILKKIQLPGEKNRAFRIDSIQINQGLMELKINAFYKETVILEENDDSSNNENEEKEII